MTTLAIHGGSPEFPEGPPTWPINDEEVHAALMAAYRDGSWGRYHGPYCERLAERLSEMHQIAFCLPCSSGTVAVELALRGLQIEEDQEVILAGYDFPGNFRSIESVGARPVLVDIDPATWCLDTSHLEEAVTAHTRAIVVSHLHGGMASMRKIMEFADHHGLKVVEDACQSPGAIVDGRIAGSWGDVSVLSFGGSKLLTAGRGGALLTNHAEIHQRIKIYCERGNHAFPLSELQAAVLLPQLDTLDERNQRRRASVQQLLASLSADRRLRPVVSNPATCRPSYYKLAFQFEPATQEEQARDEWVRAARAEGVAIDTGFRGFVRRSARRCRQIGRLVHSQSAASSTVILHHPVLLQPSDVINRVAHAMTKTLSGMTNS